MKKLLIISPYFAPVNAADAQRIRMSLPYYKALGWVVEVVVVDEKYTDSIKDPLLLQSIPTDIVIHKVKAFSKKVTSKFGLGSLALRSMYFYRKKVNQLLSKNRYDLVFFSTTEFPICVLGAYWKRKFNVPYLIDMQDPWYDDHYVDRPKSQRPKKYWIAYQMHKYLEPIAMKNVGGLMSVSPNYIDVLKKRYPRLKNKPTEVITFGAFDLDFEIAKKNDQQLQLAFEKKSGYRHIVYIGRGGYDMQPAVKQLFSAFKEGLTKEPSLFGQINFHFIGTSYAPEGTGVVTILPLAAAIGITAKVSEYTDRIGYYQSIKNLNNADGLLILGSEDQAYNASKLYPYILSKKPLLAIFHPQSNSASLVTYLNAGNLMLLNTNVETNYLILKMYLENVLNSNSPFTDLEKFTPYTSAALTKKQVDLFNKIIDPIKQ